MEIGAWGMEIGLLLLCFWRKGTSWEFGNMLSRGMGEREHVYVRHDTTQHTSRGGGQTRGGTKRLYAAGLEYFLKQYGY